MTVVRGKAQRANASLEGPVWAARALPRPACILCDLLQSCGDTHQDDSPCQQRLLVVVVLSERNLQFSSQHLDDTAHYSLQESQRTTTWSLGDTGAKPVLSVARKLVPK